MLKILENLIIGDTEWQATPFVFGTDKLNFSGDAPTPPPVPTTRTLGEYMVSPTPVVNNKYHIANGVLIGNTASPAVLADFVQPTLSANGTKGGNSFAVWANSEFFDGNYPAYKAFDENSTTSWATNGKQNPSIIGFYNPVPLKTTSIKITNRGNTENFKDGSVYASNDGTNYTQLTTFNNNDTSAYGEWTIDLSSNTEFYYYYEIRFTSYNGTNNGCTQIDITAKYIVQEAIEAQPDYVNDIKALYEDDPTQACFQQPVKIYNYELSGTVSDNNGVLSGFTPYSTNYAYIYTPFTTSGKPWNIIVDFTMGNDTSSSQGIYGTLTKDVIALHISGGTLKGYITSSGGSNWNVANGVSLLAMSANTQYRIKTEFTGTAYNWYQYINDEWTLLNSVTSSSAIADGYTLMFGSNRTLGDPFLGSINMNNTSRTIDGNTLIALDTQTGEIAWQTVNTYNGCNGAHVYDPINETVRIPHLGSYIASSDLSYGQIVGNLTINNGVVSGFSANDYILTPEFDVTSASRWQIQLTFTTGAMGTQSSLLFPPENYVMEPFIIMANAGWLAYISTNGTSWNIDTSNIMTLSANTEYKLLVEYTGSYYRFYQWNGSSWTQKKSISNSNKVKKKAQFRLGKGFNGSINLKESYFSIDGVKTYPIRPKQKVNYYLKVKE